MNFQFHPMYSIFISFVCIALVCDLYDVVPGKALDHEL